jgi:hypothetical protein
MPTNLLDSYPVPECWHLFKFKVICLLTRYRYINAEQLELSRLSNGLGALSLTKFFFTRVVDPD